MMGERFNAHPALTQCRRVDQPEQPIIPVSPDSLQLSGLAAILPPFTLSASSLDSFWSRGGVTGGFFFSVTDPPMVGWMKRVQNTLRVTWAQ